MKIKETAARRKLPKGQKNLAFRDIFPCSSLLLHYFILTQFRMHRAH